MRFFLFIFIFLLPSISLLAGENPELTVIEREIRSVIDASEWEVARDPESLTLIKKGVTLMDPKSAALSGSNDDIWDKYSFKSDYKITITVGAKITDEEYRKLTKLQNQWRVDRLAAIPNATSAGASEPIQLPRFYIGEVAVYVGGTDHGLEVRPSSIATTYKQVMNVLNKACQTYDQKPEQGADRNAGQAP